MRRDSNYDYSDLERKLNASLLDLTKKFDILDTTVGGLTTTVRNISSVSYAEIVNILNNGGVEWSKAAYTTIGVVPGTVSDPNREAYNWFRQLTSDDDLNNTTTEALKASGHSLFAANEGTNLDIPRWDIVNGRIEMGGVAENWDIAYPLPNDLIFPGLRLYFQFEAQLRTADPMPSALQFFAGFWDDTPAQQKFIEGGAFQITGEIYGDQSGTETVEYKVVAATDSGEQAISNTLVLTNAPAIFTQNNHPRIFLDGAPGFTAFDIYRLFGGEYVYLFRITNSIGSAYFDTGSDPIRVETGFPVLTQTAPQAYAKTRQFVPGSLSSGSFVRHELTIRVPTTYDTTQTVPGNQWLRFGLSGLTDVERQIVIRRIGLSLGQGNWSRSPEDNRDGVRSTVSTTAVSAPGGNTGVDPPSPDGSGGCVLMDSMIEVSARDREPFEITLKELSKRWRREELFCESGSAIAGEVIGVKLGTVSSLLHITCENGATVSCTRDHPFITDKFDITGTPASRLKEGDYLTHYGKRVRIVSIDEEFGSFEVGIPVLDGCHIFRANGFDSHNAKPAPTF